MKVSIIIPVYNMQDTIGRALRSAADQSFPKDDYEVIVVNDGSTDRTGDIIKAIANYDSKIRVISLPSNRGLPTAKNEGIKAAYGMYVIFLDADDWLMKHAVLILYEFISQHPELSFIWPGYFLVDERGTIIGTSENKEGSGVIFRKSDLEAAGLFDESVRVFEEKEMYHRLERQGKEGLWIPVNLYKYVQRPGSLSRGGLTPKETAKELQKTINKMKDDPK